MTRLRRGLVAATVLALLVAGGWYTAFRPNPTVVVVADFGYVQGIYPGNKVAILGVMVGRVRSVQPMGATVRVTMDLPSETRIPERAHAYIMSPAVISDRYVEIGPAYTGGPVMADGAVIPPERSHSPMRWDQLTSTMDTLVTALGPSGLNSTGDLGEVLHHTAEALDGHGPAIRDAVRDISQATGLLAGNSDDLGVLLDNVNRLVTVLNEHKSTVDYLTGALARIASDFAGQQTDIANTINQLSTALSQVDTLLRDHGSDLTTSIGNAANLTTLIAAHQQDLIDIIDLMPLAFDNLTRAVTPDERMRIRLNISTNLSQFPVTAELCKRIPVPLCAGPGIVNPIPIPPNLDVLTGGGK
jgi:phospholipid/cholesterol/gamma-HCH transport system substrate-binding protein